MSLYGIITKNGGGGSGNGFTSAVANYSALPTASTVTGKWYWVSSVSVVSGVKYPIGAYYSNGATYEYDTAYSQSAIWGYVANYSALPLGTTATDPQINDLVGVNTTQGTWLIGTQRLLGYYRRVAMTGVVATDYGTKPFAGFSQSSTQAQVDAGTDTDTFVTPRTASTVLQNGSYIYVTTGGTSIAYTSAFTPTITALTTGMELNINVNTSNTTTTPTINIDTLGAKNIFNKDGTAIAVGDFSGQTKIRYDGTAFRIVGGSAVPSASSSVAGISKLYTSLGTNTDGSVDQNTSTTNFNLKANIASPTFTGVPLAPTPTTGDATTKIATTLFVANALTPIQTQIITITQSIDDTAMQIYYSQNLI